MSMLILSREEVQALMPMHEAIPVNRQAFQLLAEGAVNIPPRIIMAMPEHDGASLFKPGQVGDGFGLKIVSVRPGNAKQGQDTVPATIFLADPASGFPRCIMDGTYLTAMRTAAGSGVATDLIASPTASTVVLFGAGLQAECHIHAVCCVRKITKVVVINRSRPRAVALTERLETELANLVGKSQDGIEAVPELWALVSGASDESHVQTAVEEADIICMTTNTKTPLFKGSWLKPGTHINGVGSYLPDMQEVDEATIVRCQVVVDTEDALGAGDLKIPLDKGSVTKEGTICATLGEVVVGSKSVSASPAPPKDCTMFKSVGTAVQDIATAQAVYEQAVAKKVGTSAKL